MSCRPKPTPGDLIGPNTDPVLARTGCHRSDRPEAHSAGRGTSRIGHIVGDALHGHAPPDASVWIPAVDLEADGRSWRQLQLGPGTCSERHDAFVEEVVDREDDWPSFAIDERYATDVVRSETFDALSVGHSLQFAGRGI